MTTRVESVHEMLGEIHTWFTHNLKDTSSARVNQAQSTQTSPSDETDLSLTFSIMIKLPDGDEVSELCLKACFGPDWLETMHDRNRARLFKCQCPSRPGKFIPEENHDRNLSLLVCTYSAIGIGS